MDKVWGILEEVAGGPDVILARGLTQFQAEVALCRFINLGHDAYLIGGPETHIPGLVCTEEEWIEEHQGLS